MKESCLIGFGCGNSISYTKAAQMKIKSVLEEMDTAMLLIVFVNIQNLYRWLNMELASFSIY